MICRCYLPAKGHHSSAVKHKGSHRPFQQEVHWLEGKGQDLVHVSFKESQALLWLDSWTVECHSRFAAGCSGAQKWPKRGIGGTPRWLFRLRGPDLLCANPHDPFALASRHGQVWRWWVSGPFCTWESFCVLWEMNPYGGIVVLPCYYFVLLVLNTEDTAPICFCPPYRPATGIFREYH